MLPPKGKIGLFLGSWYTLPMLDWVHGKSKRSDFARQMEENARLKKMLTAEGTLIIKFWMHLSMEQQYARLESLANDHRTQWRVSKRNWEHHRLHARFCKAAELSMKITGTAQAPWMIASGVDRAARSLTVGKVILEAMRKRLDQHKRRPPARSRRPRCLR